MLSFRKLVVIVVGCLLIAVGIDFFVMPLKVLDGGFIGIALISNYLFGVKVGIILIACSLPVFVYTWFKDRGFFFNSLFGMIFLSYAIDLLDPYNPFAPIIAVHPFVASVVGGMFIGIGFGILLKFDTSTGGVDLLAKLLAKKMKINVGLLILIMDAIVIGAGGILFSLDTFFLSIATITSGGLATSLCTSKFFAY
ncbi:MULTISPECIES: YitT family protein [Cohnella]|uniref:Putative 5xTM membrane YitT family protein n=1 Tax=Cohnella phaseoli TaxID=456490 RepID=A0A3D9HUD0_9BACL|nr:YitT family protein [Cohnella phaseoli]RED53098.1 putative 5xTM membrane YitT family protein [Cohnella phaseoli]